MPALSKTRIETRPGLNPERAFETAVGQMGQAMHLKREFEKIGETPVATWTRRLTVIERNMMLPIKAIVVLMLAYSLWTNGWRGVEAVSVEDLWVEILEMILGPYIALTRTRRDGKARRLPKSQEKWGATPSFPVSLAWTM